MRFISGFPGCSYAGYRHNYGTLLHRKPELYFPQPQGN
jgi:hypothetical protein